ncbi:hypothetical protein HU200_038864 [Digitaria exilis]|uniref:Protein kinase domain-containing protein n=1 Tax=Digitaria exilis TaxID=1010633 RepID=A0A835ELE4_9POAL|nr:hypothetical protein HU200_038864 [Digitaria exilis]
MWALGCVMAELLIGVPLFEWCAGEEDILMRLPMGVEDFEGVLTGGSQRKSPASWCSQTTTDDNLPHVADNRDIPSLHRARFVRRKNERKCAAADA